MLLLTMSIVCILNILFVYLGMIYYDIMKFQTFWQNLTKETSPGKKFLTLSRKKPFTATYHDGNIVIKPSKVPVYERPINQNEFHKVWTKASKLSQSERFVGKHYHDDTFHASYIIALMKSIVNDGEISQ
jgi:hypothetical protein